MINCRGGEWKGIHGKFTITRRRDLISFLFFFAFYLKMNYFHWIESRKFKNIKKRDSVEICRLRGI